jgi:uncharacterized protein (DUF2267 family)
MRETYLEPLDAAMHESDLWLRAMMYHLGTDDRQIAWTALRGTLHAVRDHCTPNEAARVGNCLPIPLRGLYYEGWRADAAPASSGRAQTFVARVSERIPIESGIIPEVAAQATAAVMRERIAPLGR